MNSLPVTGIDFAAGMRGALEAQNMRSEASLRRMQERQAMQEMALALEKHNREVEGAAEMAKAVGAANLASQKTIMTTGLDGIGTIEIENPNALEPEQAYLQHVVPVMAQYDPKAAFNFSTSLIGSAIDRQREGRLAKEAEDGGFTPSTGETILPDGTRIPFVRTSERQVQLVPGNAAPVVGEAVGPDGRVITTFQPSPLRPAQRVPDDIAKRQIETEKRKQQAANVEMVRTSRPDLFPLLEKDDQGFLVVPDDILRQTVKTASLQAPTRKLLEEQVIGSENLILRGKKFLNLLTPQNVGPLGALNRVATATGVDKLFGLDKAVEADKAAAMSRIFMADIFKALRSDSNINEREYNLLISNAPNASNLITQPRKEKAKLLTFLEDARDRSRANAARLGKPVSALFLSIDELTKLADQGVLTPDEAARAWNASGTSLIEQLQADLGL